MEQPQPTPSPFQIAFVRRRGKCWHLLVKGKKLFSYPDDEKNTAIRLANYINRLAIAT